MRYNGRRYARSRRLAMSSTAVLAQRIYEQIQELPEESLLELSRYLEFLRFKARKPKAKPASKEQPLSTLKIVKLEGLLKGYDFSPEFIAEARREMWKKFEDQPS
jgi:hypothetical protein